MRGNISLVMRNIVFTLVVPGLGGIFVPWLILTDSGRASVSPTAWPALAVILPATALYLWCAGTFAMIGRGTPGLWDAPRRVVAAGPYRWVRNPIYIAAVAIVSGEAWLFASWLLLLYAASMASFFHLFVTSYEEPRLARRFGEPYRRYRRDVPRWIPRPPRNSALIR